MCSLRTQWNSLCLQWCHCVYSDAAVFTVTPLVHGVNCTENIIFYSILFLFYSYSIPILFLFYSIPILFLFYSYSILFYSILFLFYSYSILFLFYSILFYSILYLHPIDHYNDKGHVKSNVQLSVVIHIS